MSLYDEMRKAKDKRLTVGNDVGFKSRLIEDYKKGLEPQKKHKTLDNFLEDSISNVILV